MLTKTEKRQLHTRLNQLRSDILCRPNGDIRDEVLALVEVVGSLIERLPIEGEWKERG